MSGETQMPASATPAAGEGPEGGSFSQVVASDFDEMLSAFGAEGPAVSPPSAPTASEAVPAIAPPTEGPAPVVAAPEPVLPNNSPLAPAPAVPDPLAIPPAPAPPVIPPELQLASLQAQNAALQQQLAEAAKAGAPTPASSPPAAGSAEPEAPAHNLSVPQEVVTALFDEDPGKATAALNHIINGLANYVHKAIRAEYTQSLSTGINGLRNELATASTTTDAATQREDMQRQYYTAFPSHNNATLQPIVAQTAAEVLAEVPNAPWNEQLVAAIGARVNYKLTGLGVAATSAPSSPAPSVAAMLPSAPAVSVNADEADEMLSTFKF